MENENFIPGYSPAPQEQPPVAPESEIPAPAYENYAPAAPAAEPTNLCPVCGAVNPVGSAFCSNCSAPFAAAQNNGFAPSYEQPAGQYGQPVQYDQNGAAYGQQNPGYYVPTVQKKKKKKLVWVLVAIIPVIIIIAIIGIIASSDTGSSSSSGSGSSYGSSSYSLDSYYINMVKNAKNSTYGITYGSAFNSFFSSPSWDYFMSTSGQHVVEFEGGFYYSGSPTTAKIQFVLDLDGGTFSAYHLSFDGEAQTKLMLSALIEKAFESY